MAISNLYEDLAKKSVDKCSETGKGTRHKNIALYHGAEENWKLILDEVKPDAVFIATNWKNHAPMTRKCYGRSP